jgi:hypothetical protein
VAVGEAVAKARPDVIVRQMTAIAEAHPGKPDMKHFECARSRHPLRSLSAAVATISTSPSRKAPCRELLALAPVRVEARPAFLHVPTRARGVG